VFVGKGEGKKKGNNSDPNPNEEGGTEKKEEDVKRDGEAKDVATKGCKAQYMITMYSDKKQITEYRPNPHNHPHLSTHSSEKK
jgi:hypothetical protein